jgi:hypothetical protein
MTRRVDSFLFAVVIFLLIGLTGVVLVLITGMILVSKTSVEHSLAQKVESQP